MTNLITIVK